MAVEYSLEIHNRLVGKFRQADLHRPMRVSRYESGAELTYDVAAVENENAGRVTVSVEKFIGGGFAGQVYRVKVINIDCADGPVGQLQAGGVYAMKILIPPSRFSTIFRNLIYWAGFQGPFQLQVSPVAARAGAIWQKFIRRAAKIRFGDESSVNDVHALFVDKTLGSCGEFSDWVEGRTWRLEADENLDTLSGFLNDRSVDAEKLGSAEYLAKREFMNAFVELLNEIGAYEFARQYEWWTCKSQPNCLKRTICEDDSKAGLTAVDFRAGLALLPFLPMSPGDFALIWRGIKRGSLVQFDRGSIEKLQSFVETKREDFADMPGMLEDLKAVERVYRNSLPDITHNHVRLLFDKQLWSGIFAGAAVSYEVRNLADDGTIQNLRKSKLKTFLFFAVGLLPFLGKVVRRIWAKPDWRKHYASMLTNANYLSRAVRGRIIEKIISWHRKGRLSDSRAEKVAASGWRFFCHLPFSILPAALHRFFTDGQFLKDKLHYICVRPIKLYFKKELRADWLREMVKQGKQKHILTDEDADTILSQVDEPFIQKYLKSLAVHVCTLPVTQIVSVIIALVFWKMHPDMPNSERSVAVAGILVLFQVIPISPGSLCRGIYTLTLAIKERDFKNYNIAVFLSFFKYIGYLAFPIQMTYHYPALARFMAGHWATEAVHIVPVFGERGALLEHWVFNLFYNWPLTIRRRMRARAQLRAEIKPRLWHVPLCAIGAAAIFVAIDSVYNGMGLELPSLKQIWLVTALMPLILGLCVTLFAAGLVLWKRIVAGAVCGAAVGLLWTAGSAVIAQGAMTSGEIASCSVWRVFIFTVLAAIGVILAELKMADPSKK